MLLRRNIGALLSTVITGIVALTIIYFLWCAILQKKNEILQSLTNCKLQALRTLEANRLTYADDTKKKMLTCLDQNGKQETDHTLAAEFRQQLYKCIEQHIPINTSQLLALNSMIPDNNKYFLPIEKEEYAQSNVECTWLTIGIGNQTMAEKDFKRLYPKCKMYGVEVVPENICDFSDIGMVIQTGIGVNPGVVEYESIYPYKKNTLRNATLRPFEEVLDRDIKSRVIHYLSLDIDGSEYPFLEEFLDHGRYDVNRIIVCQLEVELHTSLKGMSADFRVGEFLRKFLFHATSFIPIHASTYATHIKMTFIDVKNMECETLFRFSKYFIK